MIRTLIFYKHKFIQSNAFNNRCNQICSRTKGFQMTIKLKKGEFVLFPLNPNDWIYSVCKTFKWCYLLIPTKQRITRSRDLKRNWFVLCMLQKCRKTFTTFKHEIREIMWKRNRSVNFKHFFLSFFLSSSVLWNVSFDNTAGCCFCQSHTWHIDGGM